MIYIRIELHPGGNKSKARLLSEATIANVGGSDSLGNYQCLFSKVGGFGWKEKLNYPLNKILRKVNVDGFPRKRLYAHDLLLRALVAAFGDRNLPKPDQLFTTAEHNLDNETEAESILSNKHWQ